MDLFHRQQAVELKCSNTYCRNIVYNDCKGWNGICKRLKGKPYGSQILSCSIPNSGQACGYLVVSIIFVTDGQRNLSEQLLFIRQLNKNITYCIILNNGNTNNNTESGTNFFVFYFGISSIFCIKQDVNLRTFSH